jgi:TonB-linked SusC/RagA family outer membrane protein
VAQPALAQDTGTVRGRVTDAATTRPISGVQIFVPGTNRSTLSNAAGEFLLLGVSAGNATVRAAMLGYSPLEKTVTVSAGAQAQLDFVLSQEAITLDELVVTGTAGATQKRAIGNSVSSISAAQVTEVAPIANVTQLLEGRTPGLTIMAPSGTVGTASNIRIRGASSYQASNHPVFYVDGVRIQSGTQGGFGVGGQETSALDAISPEDIESIEVIKGPAAATLYGADAAAGVIQIITKKGRPGQQAIQWSARTEYGQSDWHLEMPTNYTVCTAARIADAGYPGCHGKDPGTILTGQPLKDALRTGTSLTTGLNARGGGERFSFFVSGERTDDEGVFVNNSFERTSGRANFQVTPSDALTLSANVGFTRTQTRLPQNDNASNGWLRNAYRGRPGQLGPYGLDWRGLSPTEMEMYDNQTRAERWILGTTIEYTPASWFRNRLTAGFDAGTRLSTLFYPIDRTGKAPFGTDPAKGYIDQYAPQTRNYTLDYVGTISHQFPERDLTSDLSFGMQYNAYHFESLQARGIGLFSDSVRLVSTAAQTFAFESFSETRSLGFFVQEQVGWNNRVFVTGAVRMDNNSVFGSKIQQLYYPKISASYVISEEEFFNLPGVDQFRLRAAWGRAGNAPSPFSADRTYAASTVILNDGSLASILRASSFGNPDLKAEKGSELEAGFEASLLNNRAGLEVTYYDNSTYDAMIPVSNPPSGGFTGSTLRNVGEINNKGIEVSVFGDPIVTPSFSWASRLGFSANRNRFVTFGGSRDEPIAQGYDSSQRIHEGFPMGGYWAEEILRNADGSPKLDANNRPVLSDTAVFIGASVPTREASLTNTFTFLGNLRLYVYADYKGGHYLYNMTESTRDYSDTNTEIAAKYQSPNATLADTIAYNLKVHGGLAPYIEKADFVKLREVSLSYNLPRSLISRIGVQDLSLTVAGRNLGIWTKYSGADPETNIEGAATFTRGDYMSVPMMRRLVTTVNVRF